MVLLKKTCNAGLSVDIAHEEHLTDFCDIDGWLRCQFAFWYSKLFGSWVRFPSPAVAESLKMGVYGKVSATGLCLGDVGKQTNSVGKVDGETNKVQTRCDLFEKKGAKYGIP